MLRSCRPEDTPLVCSPAAGAADYHGRLERRQQPALDRAAGRRIDKISCLGKLPFNTQLSPYSNVVKP